MLGNANNDMLNWYYLYISSEIFVEQAFFSTDFVCVTKKEGWVIGY